MKDAIMKDKNNKNNNKIKSRRGTSGFWREIAAPIFILILIPALCVWNGRKIAHDTRRWIDQIQTVENLSRQENFNAAFLTLSDSYQGRRGQRGGIIQPLPLSRRK